MSTNWSARTDALTYFEGLLKLAKRFNKVDEIVQPVGKSNG